MNKALPRPAAVAGMFYPGNPAELRRMIAAMMARVDPPRFRGRIRGIIAPHAGYEYSGLTACHAYSSLKGRAYDTVVVVSPSHREFFPGASVCRRSYETPLGLIETDGGLVDELVHAGNTIVESENGHRSEHALEVQLPFLQSMLPPFRLLPVVIGDQRRDVCYDLGEALAQVLKNKEVLIVASTDLSHFHPSHEGKRLDAVVQRDLDAFDPDGLMSHLECGAAEACGGGPAVAAMVALKKLGVDSLTVVHSSNSGDTTGDYSSVVGYLSAVAYS